MILFRVLVSYPDLPCSCLLPLLLFLGLAFTELTIVLPFDSNLVAHFI